MGREEPLLLMGLMLTYWGRSHFFGVGRWAPPGCGGALLAICSMAERAALSCTVRGARGCGRAAAHGLFATCQARLIFAAATLETLPSLAFYGEESC